MKNIEVVAAVIMDEEKRVLCTKRSSSMSIPLKWEFPGGKIEQRESNEEALIREIMEELTCTININRFFLTIKHQYPTFHLTMHSYLCEMESLSDNILLIEHDEYCWMKVNDLDTLEWAPADIPIVEELMSIFQ